MGFPPNILVWNIDVNHLIQLLICSGFITFSRNGQNSTCTAQSIQKNYSLTFNITLFGNYVQVQKSRAYQSPVVQRGRRYSTSSTISSSSGNGTSQKPRFSDKHAPAAPSSDAILEHVGRFKEVQINKGRSRNLYMNTQRQEELTDDGRSEHGNDQETSHDYSSPPGSTIGDDCSVNSLAFSETEVESRFGSECCSSGDDSRYRISKDRLSGASGSSYNRTLQTQKSASSGKM